MDADELTREILAFRQARNARLTAENGWLTQVGRYQLEPGDNQLPIGTVTLARDGVVTLAVPAGREVTFQDQPVGTRILRSDADGPPDSILYQGRTYELIRRGEFFAMRVRDSSSPQRLSFRGSEWFPVRPDWRLEGTFHPFAEERLISIPYDVGPVLSRSPGQVALEIEGRSFHLDSLMDDERRRLFILFTDATNRDLTYPAGRFLYTPLPDPTSGRVTVDFNRALNPACAFSEFVSCPLPPPQNRLPFRIEAGEKRYSTVEGS
ncbi:MAG TPA: DUF1684 domain-containing protein [Polyangia bacterium]|jgi:hypothetical protein|nr:DUF1684 domain-containing protein [Polyangia bacterium]